MITGAFVVAIPDAHLLFAMGRADARIHVEHYASRRTASVNAVDPLAGKIGERHRFLSAPSQRVSKRPIGLADAARPEVALPPTILDLTR